jgi:hypothetical protein
MMGVGREQLSAATLAIHLLEKSLALPFDGTPPKGERTKNQIVQVDK